MKRILATMLLAAAIGGPQAFAETLWGRVERASSTAADVRVLDENGRPYPNVLAVAIDSRTRFAGARSSADLRPGDAVRLEVSRDPGGVWRADSIELPPSAAAADAGSYAPAPASFAQQDSGAGARYEYGAPRSNALVEALKSPRAQKLLKDGLGGAVVGGVSAAAAGGKAGKGALIGAGANVAATLIAELLSRPAAQPYPNAAALYADGERTR